MTKTKHKTKNKNKPRAFVKNTLGQSSCYAFICRGKLNKWKFGTDLATIPLVSSLLPLSCLHRKHMAEVCLCFKTGLCSQSSQLSSNLIN